MTSTAPTMETLFQSGSGQEGISSSIINYLGNDAKIQLACTCSSMQDQVTNGNGIDIPIDPIIWGSLSDRNTDDSDRGDRFLRNMHAHLQDERKRNILQNHHYRVKIEQVHQFGVMNLFNVFNVTAYTRAFFRTLNENTAKMHSINPTPDDVSKFTENEVDQYSRFFHGFSSGLLSSSGNDFLESYIKQSPPGRNSKLCFFGRWFLFRSLP